MDARVAAALEQFHMPTVAREQRRQQWSGESCTDKGEMFFDVVAGDSGHARQSCTLRAKRSTSAKVLYSGAGEIRITSGSRQSPSTP